MLRCRLIALVLTLGLLTLTMSTAAADDWEAVGDIDGVEVERMEIEGSSIVAFRGDVVVDVHIGQIMSVFTTSDERRNWVNRYDDSRTLSRTELSETYWIRFGLPFPIKDRDYVLKADLDVNEEARQVRTSIESVTDRRMRERDCCVRAHTETFYLFEAIPGTDRTRLIVEVHTDPKGRLPSALVNRIQRSWPADTLNGLANRAGESGIEIHPDFADWHRE